MILHLSFDLPNRLEYVGCLRKNVCGFLRCAGVSGDSLEDIELMLGELAANAVQHGQAESFSVEVEFDGGWVAMTVSDQGVGFSPETIPPAGTARPDTFSEQDGERFGGWGFPLVYNLSDRVEILPAKPHGTIIRAEKRL